MYFGRWRNRFGMMSFVGEFFLFSVFFLFFFSFLRREAYLLIFLFLIWYFIGTLLYRPIMAILWVY